MLRSALAGVCSGFGARFDRFSEEQGASETMAVSTATQAAFQEESYEGRYRSLRSGFRTPPFGGGLLPFPAPKFPRRGGVVSEAQLASALRARRSISLDPFSSNPLIQNARTTTSTPEAFSLGSSPMNRKKSSGRCRSLAAEASRRATVSPRGDATLKKMQISSKIPLTDF